jgi:penicillin-binding protein A
VDRQIRRLGIAFAVLFGLLFAQVAYVQVFAADRISAEPGNAARRIRAEYETQRGSILASDERTVLANSVRAPKGSLYAFERAYPHGELYGQITGFYSRRYGYSGLEAAMDPFLAGTAPELATSNLTDLILGRTKVGGTVLTTIVPRVQQAAAGALNGLKGAVVALDPTTGRVYAMYSTPSYDPTKLSTGTDEEMQTAWQNLNADPEQPLLSKAFQQLYLPGSTFKLITASAAFENGYRPDGAVKNPHTLDLPDTSAELHNFGDEFCAGGATTVAVLEAFTESCNVPFGEIGSALGPDKLAKQAHAYGLCTSFPPGNPDSPDCSNDTISFTIPWETGRFPDASYFADRRPAVAYSAVGLDNDLFNPLQLALISATIANGGTLYEPQLVAEVRDPQGRPVKQFDPKEYGRPISPQTAVWMREMMINVVARGTGTAAQIPDVTVAGKTGTATNGENKPPNAWFTAFAPAGQDQPPKIAVAVIVLDGGSLGNEATGGQVAAPIAKQVIESFLGTR